MATRKMLVNGSRRWSPGEGWDEANEGLFSSHQQPFGDQSYCFQALNQRVEEWSGDPTLLC